MKIEITLIIELDKNFINPNCKEEREWLFEEILIKKGLLLHSNEIGDTIGNVIEVKNVKEVAKNNIIERESKFTDKVFKINRDNDIMITLQVFNVNGTSFIEYWTERGENDRKMRFEKQASFDIKRRLLTWKSNNYNNAKPTYTDKVGEYLNR